MKVSKIPAEVAGLAAVIEEAKSALNQTDRGLDSVEEGIAKAGELLNFIERTFEETGNPDLVLDDLKMTKQFLSEVEDDLDSISEDLVSIRETLERIAEAVRKLNQRKLTTELKKAFELLEGIEERFSNNMKEFASIQKALDQLTEEISSAFTAVGRSGLKPANESGVQAKIVFVDDGTTLMVVGTATGLDPDESYLSNIYDIGSASEGPIACVPSIFDPEDPDFILPTMFLGFWKVDPDGNGRLCAVNTNSGADFVPLDKIGTVSVRLFVAPPPAPGAPPMTELVACGRVSALN